MTPATRLVSLCSALVALVLACATAQPVESPPLVAPTPSPPPSAPPRSPAAIAPSAPAPQPASAASASAAPPTPPTAAASAPASASATASATASAKPLPPPSPPMSVRWSLFMPAFGPHGSLRETLQVEEDGSGLYERVDSGGHEGGHSPGDPPGSVIRCRARVAPDQHRALVEAARKAIAGGACTDDTNRRGMPSWRLEFSHGTSRKQCAIDRDKKPHVDYEKVHSKVIDAICRASRP